MSEEKNKKEGLSAVKKPDAPDDTATQQLLQLPDDDNNNDADKKASVRFAPDTKPPSTPVPTRRNKLLPPVTANEARRRMGKANLKRDLSIFLAVFAFLAYVAYISDDVGKPMSKEDRERLKHPPTVRDIKSALTEAVEGFKREEEGRRRKTDCGLFLADSTIPSAGLSWFAGRNFSVGDLVLETGREIQEGILQNELNLKHHPVMVNIERDQAEFRATRHIQQGEELFLDVAQHPHARLGADHALFHNVPTAKDYIVAEEIFLMEAEVQLRASFKKKRPAARGGAGGVDRSAGGGMYYYDESYTMIFKILLAYTLYSRQVTEPGVKSGCFAQSTCRPLATVQSRFPGCIFSGRPCVSLLCSHESNHLLDRSSRQVHGRCCGTRWWPLCAAPNQDGCHHCCCTAPCQAQR